MQASLSTVLSSSCLIQLHNSEFYNLSYIFPPLSFWPCCALSFECHFPSQVNKIFAILLKISKYELPHFNMFGKHHCHQTPPSDRPMAIMILIFPTEGLICLWYITTSTWVCLKRKRQEMERILPHFNLYSQFCSLSNTIPSTSPPHPTRILCFWGHLKELLVSSRALRFCGDCCNPNPYLLLSLKNRILYGVKLIFANI